MLLNHMAELSPCRAGKFFRELLNTKLSNASLLEQKHIYRLQDNSPSSLELETYDLTRIIFLTSYAPYLQAVDKNPLLF